MVLGDAATARLRVDQMRAGDLDGYTVGGLVDVRYGDDVRFLSVGTRYLVGVVADPQTRVLVSRVRAEAPLFGGSQIEGVPGDECPQVPDPVRTLQLDGGAVDTGVLSPLAERPVSILAAVGIAVAAVLGALVVLAALRLTFAASLAALRRVR